MYQGQVSKNEYAGDFHFGPSVTFGLVKSLPKDNLSVFIDNSFNIIPLIKFLKQTNIHCAARVKANMFADYPLPLKTNLKSNKKGVIKVV